MGAYQGPVSYKDPAYDEADAQTTQRLGLPAGLLSNIRLKGERSNADQVSTANARTPYQITGTTRKLIMDKYGIDPWLNAQNASLGAGYLLKESMDRNKGNPVKAVQEYHGGTDPRNYGPVNRAYVQRVTGDQAEFDQQFAAATAPKATGGMKAVMDAYTSGKMNKEDAAAFAGLVKSGQVLPPSTFKLRPEHAAKIIPKVLVDKYNNLEMSKEDAAAFEQMARSSDYDLPPGAVLNQRTEGYLEQAGKDVKAAGADIVGTFDKIAYGLTDLLPESANAWMDENINKPLGLMTKEEVGQRAMQMDKLSEENTRGTMLGGIPGGVAKFFTGTVAGDAYNKTYQSLRDAGLPDEDASAIAWSNMPINVASTLLPVKGMKSGAGGAAGVYAVNEALTKHMLEMNPKYAEIAKSRGIDMETLIKNAALGGVLGRIAQGKTETAKPEVKPEAKPVTPELQNKQEIVKQAEQRNIPVMTTDVNPPTTFIGRSAQTAGERVPVVGTGPMRQQQAVARKQAVKDFVQEFGDGSIEGVADDLAKTRKAEIEKYSSLKKGVIENIKGEVNTSKTLAQIDKEIADLRDMGPAVPKKAFELLDNFRRSLQGKDLSQIESVRKLLGDQLKDPELASASSILDKIPSRIYGALREDMGAHIKQFGERRDFTKWSVANTKLAAMIDEASNAKFRRALNDASTTPETAGNLLFSKNASDVKRLTSNLSERGKAHARATIVQRAMSDAQKGLAEGDVSVPKFMSKLEDLQQQTGLLFTKEQKAQAEGLMKVLKATRRADESPVLTKSGQEVYTPAAAAGLTSMFGLTGGLGAAAGIGVLARMIEGPRVRNMLIKAGRSKPGTPMESRNVRIAMQTLSKASEVAARGNNARQANRF